MRLMYLITRGDSIGGAQIHVRDLAVYEHDIGHEVIVVTGIGGALTDKLNAQGVRTQICPGMLREISPLKDFGAIRALRKIIQSERPDLLSTHSSKAGIIGRLAAKWAGVPAVFTAHGWAFTGGVPEPKRSIYKVIERIHEPLSARIICVSNHDRELGIASGMKSDRLIAIHNGIIDIETKYRAQPIGDEPLRAVMTARFDHQKDHETLFRALTNVPGLTLDLIGDGPGRAQSEDLAKRIGIQERVNFLGQRADVERVLSKAHIFVLSSRWEGFPRSTLEAMRAGLPVVVSRVGGAAEAISDGKSGFVVQPGDRDELAARLRDLIRNPNLRAAMGAAGRARYEAEFTFARMYATTHSAYLDVLNGASQTAK